MELVENNWVNNKTKRYLIPILKLYSKDLVKVLNTTFKLAAGIHDMNSPIKGKRIFLLVRNEKADKKSIKLLIEWFRLQTFYADDYQYIDSYKHMLVFKCEGKFEAVYDSFVENKYSEMYLDLPIFNLIKDKDIINVLIKDIVGGREYFSKVLMREYNLEEHELEIEWETVNEYDTPIFLNEEVFNNENRKILTKTDMVWLN